MTKKGPSIAPHPHVEFKQPAPSPVVGSWIRCSFPWDLSPEAVRSCIDWVAIQVAWNQRHPSKDGLASVIIYDIGFYCTDIVYDIGIRYRIPINMVDYGLVVSYVYIVPLFYLNCVLKGYLRWSLSLQMNGKAFQSPVEVFWIEVHPIWNTTQELMNWSKINSRELSCRIILVHEITMIVKVHFMIMIFIAATGRQTWKTWSCVGTSNHISISISYAISYTISYAISYTILRTLKF